MRQCDGARLWTVFAVATLLTAPLTAQTVTEKKLRDQAVEGMQRQLADEVKRNGGSYEAWMWKLAPLHEKWKENTLDRTSLYVREYVSTDSFHIIGLFVNTLLMDLSVRPDGSQPLKQLLELHQQLQAKGIDLIVATVPTTPEVFPEKTVGPEDQALVPADGLVSPYLRKFYYLLASRGVEVMDFAAVLRAAKAQYPDQVVLRNELHWSNRGAMLCAKAVAERLMRYEFIQKAQPRAKQFKTKESVLKAFGQDVVMSQVITPEGKLFEEAEHSPILVVGDSNMMIWDYENPNAGFQPAGAAHAGFTAHLARYTGVSPSQIAVQALTVQQLNREPAEQWQGRRVVIYVNDLRVLSSSPWNPAEAVHLK